MKERRLVFMLTVPFMVCCDVDLDIVDGCLSLFHRGFVSESNREGYRCVCEVVIVMPRLV